MTNTTLSVIYIILLIIGVIMIIRSIHNTTNNPLTCNSEKIIYRYIPRSFDEEQTEPVYVSDIFRSMFEQSSPWIISINEIDHKKYDEINKFFISQS